jgi:hypothetical protein
VYAEALVHAIALKGSSYSSVLLAGLIRGRGLSDAIVLRRRVLYRRVLAGRLLADRPGRSQRPVPGRAGVQLSHEWLVMAFIIHPVPPNDEFLVFSCL